MRHHVLRENIYGISVKGRYLPALLLAGVMTVAGAGTATAASVAASGVDVSAYQMSLPGGGNSSATGQSSAASAVPTGGATIAQDQSIGTHYATVQSAEINAANPAVIDITVNAAPLVGSGQQLYLFAVKPYQMNLDGRTDYLAVQDVGNGSLQFTADLQDGPNSLRTYDAFVLAIASGNGYQIVSNRCYIGNPELIAADQSPALNRGKKGLLVDPNILDDAIDLGIKHAFIPVTTAQLFGTGVSYSYDGKVYSFDSALIQQLDQEISRLSGAGVAVTVNLVNGWNPTQPALYRPGTKVVTSDAALYYGFNVETEDGFQLVKAMATFLASRYNGHNGHGKITNWVIGNEINNQYWNYVGNYSVRDYTRIFQRTFRVFYTAIKSVSANDNVMFSLDQYWTIKPEAGSVGKYPGKDVLDNFMYIDQEEGKTNWALAIHPYPYPLTDPNFWDDFSSGKVTNDLTTAVISYANLSVLTNYMHSQYMLDKRGQVRNIFMTEEGFSSVRKLTQDAQMEQAAAVAYGHYIVENNPDIDAYMLSRQLDNAAETKDGLYFGLSSVGADGASLVAKPAREVFKYIDDPNTSLMVSDFAKTIIGISDWAQAIPGFHF